ncbi:MAG: tyrosine-type recombinase/integrase [Methanocorpusculum sp.]|nr:tyrosine-type recombinase/integrase [Methanocorpusculum sp.]
MLKPSEFLEFTPKRSTKSTYETALKRYLEITFETKIRYSELDKLWINYLKSKRDINNDFIIFSSVCKNKLSLAPKTLHLYSKIVLMYLKYCGVELTPNAQRQLKNFNPKNRPISKEAELTKEKIRIMASSADTRLRAEILTAVSSGMRIGELLGFKISNIDFSVSPVEIYLFENITKNKTARKVFISGEAAEALKKWLSVRENELKRKVAPSDENRCFPYSVSNEISRLKHLLVKTRLYETDSRTNRATIHFHMFRKFFLTEFKLAASEEVAEELAGHQGYLSSSYRRITASSMKAEYKKAEPYLTIFNDERCISEKSLCCVYCAELEKEVKGLRTDIKNLMKSISKNSIVKK